MALFSGGFQYLDESGAVRESGSCGVTVDQNCLQLIAEKGPPMVLDLGDIDGFSQAEYSIFLKLYAGSTLILSRFGKAYQNLCHDLLEAYRSRLVQCLLLEDLEEIERFEGTAQLDSAELAFSSRAELRLYKSNLAVLPETATATQWRLADIDAVDFDEATYTLGLRSASDRLILTRLAKRTREFIDRLQSAMADLSKLSAGTLQSLFPFLSPEQFRQVAGLMREGRAAPVARLNAINPRIASALVEKTVDVHLKPYFSLLADQTLDGSTFAGFKQIRPETEERESHDGAVEVEVGGAQDMAEMPAAPERYVSDDESSEEPVLHWFFFVMKAGPKSSIPSNVVAWESTSRSGRATYFFRLLPQNQAGLLQNPAKASAAIESAVTHLNCALVLLNFRREPIYLPDDSLERQARYHRYAVACRKIPALRQLRESYLGRALHTSPEAWQQQMQSILSGTGTI